MARHRTILILFVVAPIFCRSLSFGPCFAIYFLASVLYRFARKRELVAVLCQASR